jgi:hypothetical protein
MQLAIAGRQESAMNTTMEKPRSSTKQHKQQADPLATRRQRRDRVSDALNKAHLTYDYAGQRTQDSINDALKDPAFPGAALPWVRNIQHVVNDPNFGTSVWTPTVPVDLASNSHCSTIFNWAGKRERASGIRTNLTRKLVLAENALAAGAAQNPQAPNPSAPAAVAAPADDDAADKMLEESHEEYQAFGPGNDFRCGVKTVGHHSPKNPCRNLLGADGVCQDHP